MTSIRGAWLFIKVFTICFIFTASPLFSEEDDFYNQGWSFKLSGYYKNIFMYQETNEFYSSIYSSPEDKKMISDLNRIRFSPEINYSEIFTFHADMDGLTEELSFF